MGNTYVYNMLNGMNLLAEEIKEHDDSWEVKRPLLVNLEQNQSGNMSISLVDPRMFAPDKNNETLHLRKNLVMMKYSPTEELASHYRQTVSGLIMPTNDTGWDTKIGETSGLLNE